MNAPINRLYTCFSDAVQISIDGRFDAWLTQFINAVPKVAYDGDWQLAGGTVGSFTYRNALALMGSSIEDANIPPLGVVPAVVTPTAYLIDQSPNYLAALEGDDQCGFIVGFWA